MSKSTNNSPPAATVWPPPPSSAPETFTVEGVTVTKHGEQLTISSSKIQKIQKHAGFGLLGQFLVCGGGWFFSVHLLFNLHQRFGTRGPALSDPIFLRRLEMTTLTYLIMSVFFIGIQWYAYERVQNMGVIVLRRPTREVQSGAYLDAAKAINVVRQSVFGRHYYLVTILAETAQKKRRSESGNFRSPSNSRKTPGVSP